MSSASFGKISFYGQSKMNSPKSNHQNKNRCLNQTTSLIYWPILRRIPLDVLREVELFKIFNNGQSAILIKKDGLYAFGDNSFKWLGVGDKNRIDPVEKIDKFNHNYVENIAVGTNFVLILATGGQLFGAGNNSDGQIPNLANKNSVDRFSLLKTHIKQVACGSRHVLALDFNGMIWAWGNNQHHQCLECPEQKIIRPDFVARSYFRMNRIVEIACGYESSIALDQRAGLYVWGYLCSIYFERPTLIKIPIEENDCIKSIHGTYDACVAVSHFGKVFQCYARNKRLCFQPIEPETLGPIEFVLTRWYNNQLIMYSKEKSLYLWSEEEQTPIKVSSSITIPDVSNLYCDPNTPCLTQLPVGVEKNEIRTPFNDPARSDLKIIIGQALLPRFIYMNSSSIADSLKRVIDKIGNSSSNTEELILDEKYSYAVLFQMLYIFSQNMNLNSIIDYFGQRLSVYNSLEELIKEKLSAEDLIELYSLALQFVDCDGNFLAKLSMLIIKNFRARVNEDNFIKLYSIISQFSLTRTALGKMISNQFIDQLKHDDYKLCFKMKCFEDSLQYNLNFISRLLFKIITQTRFANQCSGQDEVEKFEQEKYLKQIIVNDHGRLKQLACDYDPKQEQDYHKFVTDHPKVLVLHVLYNKIKNHHNIDLLKYMVNFISQNYLQDFWILFYFYELSLENDPQDETKSNSYLHTSIRSLISNYETLEGAITDLAEVANPYHSSFVDISRYIKSHLISLDEEFHKLSLTYDIDSDPRELLAFIYFQFYDLAQRHKDFPHVFRLRKIICEKFFNIDVLHYLPVAYMLSLFYKDRRFRLKIHQIIMEELVKDNIFPIFDVLNKYEPDDEFLDEFCEEMSEYLDDFSIMILYERTIGKQTRPKFQRYFVEQLSKHLSLLNCGNFYQSLIAHQDVLLLPIVQRYMIEKVEPEYLLEFYRLSIEYQDSKLQSDLRQIVQKNLDAKNICSMLQLALKESDHETLDICFQAIEHNIDASNCFALYKLSSCSDQEVRWKNVRPLIAKCLVKNIKPDQKIEAYCLAAQFQDELIIKHLQKSSQLLVKRLNSSNLESVYQSALFANDEFVLQAIEKQMGNHLTITNCLKIYELAFTYQDFSVRQLVAKYWLEKRRPIRLPSGMDSMIYEQLQNDANNLL